jgi:glycerol-3-phosphate dehydrogenase (NAD(P)+)
MKLKMVAEGYYAVKCINEINEKQKIEIPIAETVYNILYDKKSPKNQMRLLSDRLN